MPETVLIVDDEPAIGAALAVRLEAHGYRTELAGSGLAGLEAARRHRPAVALLDIRLPDIDGLELCRRLKADPALASIPVVFISANGLSSVRDQAFEVGGKAFLKKPYDANEVLAIVAKLAGGSPAAQNRSEQEHAR